MKYFSFFLFSLLKCSAIDNQEQISNTPKTALVTGITGQDGAYMSRFLLDKGYEVFGSYRRTSCENFWRIEELKVKEDKKFTLTELDITDMSSAIRVLLKAKPHEVYNFASQTFVGVSFHEPIATAKITGLGTLHLLEAIRLTEPMIKSPIKFYQASTSELFGLVQEIPQTEKTPFYPRSPYGVAKQFAHWTTINYRESYNIFACCGILFNHESPLRGTEFVTRKITRAVARIKHGKQEVLELGNLDSKRDWGYSGDFIEGIYAMMQQTKPDDFVLATGRCETVRFFVEKAFEVAGIKITWEGCNQDEKGFDSQTGIMRVVIDPKNYRPAEVALLVGNASKAKHILNWQPKVQLEELIAMMVEADLKREQKS
jgi:GDPmannose 4,6-dehydratase